MINMEDMVTYDDIYMELWEFGQRFFPFVNFRIIGNSHDNRMIPMLEIGKGEQVLFCISGVNGEEIQCCHLMMKMIKEYCSFYERNWEMDDLYKVKQLLDKVRICMIPVMNPDGYEIARNGYLSIRNPVLRQILRMQDIPYKEYEGNGRNTKLTKDFPLMEDYMGEIILDEVDENDHFHIKKYSIENETKSLINIFKEYESIGLIIFGKAGGKIVQYKYSTGFSGIGRDRRIASQFKKLMGYRLEAKRNYGINESERVSLKGDCGQYFAKFIHKPAFRIDIPETDMSSTDNEEYLIKCYQSLKTIPLEFIFSI